MDAFSAELQARADEAREEWEESQPPRVTGTWSASGFALITDMSESDYHASSGIGPDKWVTRSVLRDYLESPSGCYLRHVVKEPLAQFNGNSGTAFGTVLEALSEGQPIESVAIVRPAGIDLRTKAGKAWQEEQHANIAAGMPMVGEDEIRKAKLLIERMRAHPICRYCFDTATDRQVVVRWTDSETGLRLQVRIDLVRRERFLADLKTGIKEPAAFVSSADLYGYDLQAAMYSRGWDLATGEGLPFCFPYAQTSYPFETAVIQLPDQITDNADVRLRRAIEGIAAGQWGEEQDKPMVPEVPWWWTSKREALVGGIA
jgi:hypothetical protein